MGVSAEGQRPDPGFIWSDLEDADHILNELDLPVEIRTPDTSGFIQDKGNVSRLIAAS